MHKSPLEAVLVQNIKDQGAMNFGAFMEHALVHPEYGYYTNRDPFGAEGDFTTAPEISQMFGEMIGAWVVDTWQKMDAPPFDLIECGPGRGTLMADIMRVGSKVEGFVQAAHIHLVEASDVLKKKQKAILSGYKVRWHESIDAISQDHPCVILGNEFLDALPVEQLQRGALGWQQRVIIIEGDEGSFAYDWREASDNLIGLLPQKTESSCIYEVSPDRNLFVQRCAERLKRVGGAALFIDYGHSKSHHGDTVQAVRRHKFINVLENVGQCDITAHVDFDALSRALTQYEGIKTLPIITQRAFLMAMGIEYRAMILRGISDHIEKDLERLIGQKDMGDLFKVMCFYKDPNLKPAGFF